MVATFCQTQPEVSDPNSYQLLQISGCCCGCPTCQFTPPINEFTYCVLKNICKKILREICQEQKKEVYTVFDGGRCSKYEALIKDARSQSKNENQSTCVKTCNQGKRASIKERVVCQSRKRRSLDQSDQKAAKKKETNLRGKEIKTAEKDGDREAAQKEKQHTEEAIPRNENSHKTSPPQEKAARERLEREKADRYKARTMKEIEKAQADFRVNPFDRRNHANRRGSQGNCGKQKRGLLVNRLDIDRDFSKRQGNTPCRRFERVLISPGPCRNPCGRACALSRVDSIRPCDYMRANMEFNEMCRPRVFPPCETCVPSAPWFALSSAW